jgi:hypothetical protein
MFGWHLVFDGSFALERSFDTSGSTSGLNEEFSTFLLPNAGAWGFMFSLAPQNQSVADWMFGVDEETTGAELALFSTDNAMVSVQFHQDNGNDDTQRFVYPLVRYSILESTGEVCFSRQVDLAVRGTGYLPTVDELDGGLQLLVMMSTISGQHRLKVLFRQSSGELYELYTVNDFLSGMNDDCSDSALSGTTSIDGFNFGLGLNDGNLLVNNLIGRVDDLMLFDLSDTDFSVDTLERSNSDDTSDGFHYDSLNFVGNGEDGYGWWGFEKYSHNGPSAQSHLAMDMSPLQPFSNNILEFCSVIDYQTECISEPEQDSIEFAESKYRRYDNSEFSLTNW